MSDHNFTESDDDFHFTFPHDYAVTVIEPLTRYHLRDRARDAIIIDAEFTALFLPRGFADGELPFARSPHLDQMVHIVGERVVHGQAIPIDSYSFRDRSWATRMDYRGSRIGYSFGCAKDIAFCWLRH